MGGLRVALFSIGITGCSTMPGGDAPPAGTGFPLAYAFDDCAPWDGRALTILLSQVEIDSPLAVGYPHVRIASWRPPEPLPGGTAEWSGTAQSEGHAALCDAAEACVTARSVRLRFDPDQGADGVLQGDLHLELDGGRVIEGPFRARRLPFSALCGG